MLQANAMSLSTNNYIIIVKNHPVYSYTHTNYFSKIYEFSAYGVWNDYAGLYLMSKYGKISKIEHKWCNLNQIVLYLSRKLGLVIEKF